MLFFLEKIILKLLIFL